MSKEEDIKKIELKVTVDCCDGCKKKVLKALAVKGVLRTDIHPSLPRVTVLGNVEPQKLIKKLAKCGKIAELLPVESKKQETRDKKSEGVKNENSTDKVDEKEKPKEGVSGKKAENFSKNGKTNREEISGNTETKTDKDSKITVTEENSKCNVGHQIIEGVKSVAPTNINISAAQEPLSSPNYFINASMAQATQAQVYYTTTDHNCTVPMSYYMPTSYPIPPVATSYPAYTHHAPPPMTNSHPGPTLYYLREPCYHDVHSHQPQLVNSLPPRLTEYFNDENTGGCHVM